MKISIVDVIADAMGIALCIACFIFFNRNTLIAQGGIILINPTMSLFWNMLSMLLCLIVISFLLETMIDANLKSILICVLATLGVYFSLISIIRFLIMNVNYDACVTFYMIFQAFVAISIGDKRGTAS